MPSHPFYAPDGMGMSGHVPERAPDLTTSTHDPVLQQLLEVVLPHEREDDGLVHSHNWAVSSNSPAACPDTRGYFIPALAQRDCGPTSGELQQVRSTQVDDCYDDGLVHNHHWAITKL